MACMMKPLPSNSRLLLVSLAFCGIACKPSKPPALPADLSSISPSLKYVAEYSSPGKEQAYEVKSSFDDILATMSASLPGKGWEFTNVHGSPTGIRTVFFIKPNAGMVMLVDHGHATLGIPQVELSYIGHTTKRVDPKTKLLVSGKSLSKAK